jgi:hypothetical protein
MHLLKKVTIAGALGVALALGSASPALAASWYRYGSFESRAACLVMANYVVQTGAIQAQCIREPDGRTALWYLW